MGRKGLRAWVEGCVGWWVYVDVAAPAQLCVGGEKIVTAVVNGMLISKALSVTRATVNSKYSHSAVYEEAKIHCVHHVCARRGPTPDLASTQRARCTRTSSCSCTSSCRTCTEAPVSRRCPSSPRLRAAKKKGARSRPQGSGHAARGCTPAVWPHYRRAALLVCRNSGSISSWSGSTCQSCGARRRRDQLLRCKRGLGRS